jgi:hypothetical protein
VIHWDELRSAVALVLLGGCNLVFGIDTVMTVPAPCGPYTTITPVPINGVTAPKHFSIAADGMTAMVVGKDAMNIVRPIALVFDGTSWVPDPAHQIGLAQLVGAHLAPPEGLPDGNGGYSKPPVSFALIAWLGHPLQVDRYYFAAQWVADNPVFYADADYDVTPGNVVVTLNAGTNQPIRHIPVAKHATSAENPDQIMITVNALPDYDLREITARTAPLNTHGLMFDQAVLTDDQQKLVYAAQTKPGSFEIYASLKDTAFDVGGPIASVNTPDADEVEPWIDATCTKLYFRRVATGQSGDPGTIFVAE